MNQPLWNVATLAAYIGKPVSWVYDNHVREGIPSFRIGQQLRFDPAEVQTWISDNCRETP